MSYVEQNLNQDEKIITEAKRSLLLLLTKFISTAAWVLISIVACVLLKQPIVFVIAVFSLISCACELIKFKRNKLTLTSNRVIFRKGVFNTRSVDMFYEQIETVEISQNFWGKIFHFSTVDVSTGGIGGRIAGVIDGDKLKNTIMEQVDIRKKAAAEEQAQMQAKAMREAFAAMQQSNSNSDT